MTSPETTAILQELATGRIDAAEAARRLDALKSSAASAAPAHPAPTPAEPPRPAAPSPPASPEPASPEPASPKSGSPEPESDQPEPNLKVDAWAAETDRPQRATHAQDAFPQAAPTDSGRARPDQTEPADLAPPTRPVNTSGVERISVRAVGRRVRIVGETGVATLSADGPHVLRRNGSVLEVSSDGELGASLDGFSILRAPRSLDDIRALGLGKELFLRVNPAVVVDVEVTAGSLHTESVPHLGKVRVTAGGARLLDVAEVDDALVQAGQATLRGAITGGRSRIRAESGSLTVELADTSDVTITGEAQLGRISWSGAHSGAGDEVVMGHGRGRLEIGVVMGHAAIRAGSLIESDTA